jgi:hypothetical protein
VAAREKTSGHECVEGIEPFAIPSGILPLSENYVGNNATAYPGQPLGFNGSALV